MKTNFLSWIALIAGVVALIGALAIAFELFAMLKFVGEFGSELNPTQEASDESMDSLLAAGQRVFESVHRLVLFHVVVGIAMGSGVICLALDLKRLRHQLKD